MTTMTAQTTQVYRVFIKASADEIWEAICKPEFTERYFYGARISNSAEGHLGLGPNDEVWGRAEVTEFDPPRRLVHSWVSFYDEEMAAEEPSRVRWEIEPQEGGYSLLTVVHDQLEGAPKTAASVAGPGWTMVLSGLKTLLETGEPLTTF